MRKIKLTQELEETKIKKEDEVEEFAEASTIGSAIHEAFKESYILGKLTPKLIEQKKEVLISQEWTNIRVKFVTN